MNRRVAIPDDIFTELAAGAGGARAMQFLARHQRNKHMLLVRLVVAKAGGVRELSRPYDLLAGLQAEHPAAVDRLLRHPAVGVWAIGALHDLDRGRRPDHGYLSGLAATAAVLTRVECAIEVPAYRGHVFLPFLGRALLPGPRSSAVATVRSTANGAEVVTPAGALAIPPDPESVGDGWQAIRHMGAVAEDLGISLLLDDLDTYLLPSIRRTDRIEDDTAEHWERSLSEAWALLVATHREVAEEIAAGLTTLVPMRETPGRDVSATSRHAFGAVAMSRPHNGRTFAAVLAHERQHAKLNAVLDLVQLLADEPSDLWYAPWRDDPRPLAALLQGAYAHLGLAAFWRRQRHDDQGELATHAHAEFAHLRLVTRQVVGALQRRAALTRHGARFVDDMAATLDAWRNEPVPLIAARRAHSAAAQHRIEWRRRHGSATVGLVFE